MSRQAVRSTTIDLHRPDDAFLAADLVAGAVDDDRATVEPRGWGETAVGVALREAPLHRSHPSFS